MINLLYLGVAIIVGAIVGFIFFKIQQKQIVESARREKSLILEDAKRKSKSEVEDARRKFERSQQKNYDNAKRAEERARDIERGLKEQQRDLQSSKDRAESAAIRAEKSAEEAERRSQSAEQIENHFKEELQKVRSQLEKIAGMTQKEAQEALIQSIEEDAKLAAAKKVRSIEENARDDAEKLSKRIISIAVSRYASEYTPERTTSTISLPNDEIKGRLIGREGRNIRALESATGCEFIIDDTPETVIVSCFDPVRRHVGKRVLEQLIGDGRVHPTRIEEIVNKVQKATNKSIKEAGENALLDLGIVGMHPELFKKIGELQFRYSYSQNQYHHVIETGYLCGLMAAELNLDVKQARRAGLLHDIGKALTHEVEGSHAVIGADLCEKYGEAPEIVHAIRAHHEDVKPESWLDFLVIGADAMSGARPGARREQLDNYIKRLQDLERIANAFPGVERSFAVAAGREIRVMVENSRVNDERAVVLSRDIAKKIEQDMIYPGQIMVTVIRETRATTLAK